MRKMVAYSSILSLFAFTMAFGLNGSVAKAADTGPIISNVSIKSNNANPALARNGDIITLTFTTDEPVTKLSNFKINSSNPDTFTNVGNDYTATHLVDAGDPVTGAPATFQINVQNAAGIFSLTVEATNDGSSVTIVSPATLAAEDFGVVTIDAGALGTVKGYTAGFGLTDATFAGSSVKMELFNGTTLLQTNTSTAKVGTDVTGTQISSPFDVSGNFNYAADGFWTNVREAQFGQSVAATRVVATVTLADGQVLTAENNTLAGNPTTIFARVLTSVTLEPATATIAVDDDDDDKDNRGKKHGDKKKQIVTVTPAATTVSVMKNDKHKHDDDDEDDDDDVPNKVQLTATPLDQNGVVFVGATTTFTSSDPAMAKVNSSTGLVTAVKKGTATITATSVSGTVTVTDTSVITLVKDDDDDDNAPKAKLKVTPFVFDPAAGDCVGILAAFDPTVGNPGPSLHLTKPCATTTNAATGATLTGFSGPLTSLAFDFKSDGHCGAGAPRFNVQTNVGFHFLGGCANGTKTDLGNGWTRVTIDPTNPAQAFPVVAANEVVQSIDIIFDEGNDALGQGTPGSVFMDNISVNGLVSGGPVVKNDDKDKHDDGDKNKGKNDNKGSSSNSGKNSASSNDNSGKNGKDSKKGKN